MHIGYITTEYPPLPSGGIGTSIKNLANKLVEFGHTVTVIGLGPNITFNDGGVNVKFVEGTKRAKLGWLYNRYVVWREIERLIRHEALNIVEAPDWLGLSAGMPFTCPVVIRCHGSDTYFGHLLGYKPRITTYLYEYLALTQADSISAVTHFTADTTKKIFRLKRDIGVIPNSINFNQFSSLPYQEDDNLIINVGTLNRKKGVLDLCKVFNFVVEKRPNTHLAFIGRDSKDKIAGVSTKDLCINTLSDFARDRTEFLGLQPYSKIQDHINRAAVCAFPSYAESFGLSWIEAMACSKAVVASNIGWAPEIIIDGESGVLHSPNDHEGFASKIIGLLDNKEERKKIGNAARKRVGQLFSSERVAALSIDWYKSVIN